MHRNYFTIYHAARELREKLQGGTLDSVASPARHELVMRFSTPQGNPLELVLFTKKPLLSFFVHEGNRTGKQNRVPLWPEVHGKSVREIEASPVDRELHILLDDEREIKLQLFTSRSNAFLFERGAIAGSFEHRDPAPRHACMPILRELEKLALYEELFIARLHNSNVMADLPGFDSKLHKELLRRSGGNPTAATIHTALQDLFYELIDPVPQVGEDDQGIPVFSIIGSALPKGETFASVLDGLEAYAKRTLRTMHTRGELRQLQDRLEHRIRKIRREIEGASREKLLQQADMFERFGHILTGAIGRETPGDGSITLSDFLDPAMGEVTIPIKSAENLQQNAAEYFRKAGKARKGAEAMHMRISSLQKELERLEALQTESVNLDSVRDVRRFLEGHHKELPRGRKKGKEAQQRALPYRTLTISDNATLLVGRNAAGNEALTFGNARPEDIWLHAQGCPGSHCILKGVSLDHTQEINRAAQIAAWHSMAKHSELVPVICTLKKYVRKSRHLPKGEVAYEREKILFVKPERNAS